MILKFWYKGKQINGKKQFKVRIKYLLIYDIVDMVAQWGIDGIFNENCYVKGMFLWRNNRILIFNLYYIGKQMLSILKIK